MPLAALLQRLSKRRSLKCYATWRQRKKLNTASASFTGFCGGGSSGGVFQVSGTRTLSNIDIHLIDLFCRNVNIAFENIYLKNEVEDTQKEIVFRLGGAVETRSQETGNHLKRVSEYSHMLAISYGLSSEKAEIIRLASPLYDVGKVGIPDLVLNKPGQLEADEWKVMQDHAYLGHEMLKDSKRPVLRAGATIALEHHEHWNGAGYPSVKAGEDIHLYGRIAAPADVFDALSSQRCYKEPWELDRIMDHLQAGRGAQFEPKLVDILVSQITEFTALRASFPD
jgi:response regulator RpfG family c-di-GMP phosphodiesterase